MIIFDGRVVGKGKRESRFLRERVGIVLQNPEDIKIDDSRRKHLVNNEKDSGTDDPIRLYLRERL